MTRLFDAYRAVHEQGFMPIFVKDEFDSRVLLEGCLLAGLKAIEYTLRRPDAHKMIPQIRKEYPDLFLLAGSTVDCDHVVACQKRKFPQLMTVAELDALGVDGFVSMIGWSEASIRKYSPTKMVVPTASTISEAFFQVAAGAQFIKLGAGKIDLIRGCRQAAAFEFCPIFSTGGLTPERIPETVAAGAVVVASGFDLTLKGRSKDITAKEVAEVLRQYVDAARAAREKTWPQLARAAGLDRKAWLDSLPHWHPFS
jgi:2-keto-3-deoxy-6-phosphogluconate aldolase